MNVSSKSEHELVNSEDFSEMIENIKKLSYAVGCYNAFHSAFLRTLDSSMFGINIGFEQGSSPYKTKIKDMTKTKISLLHFTRQIELMISKEVLTKINNKLKLLEMLMAQEIPNMKSLFREIAEFFQEENNKGTPGKRRASSVPQIRLFPKLEIYDHRTEIFKKRHRSLTFNNIRFMRYDYSSDLIFLVNTENSLIVYDLIQKTIYSTLNQWPFPLSDIKIRRDLNYYTSPDVLKIQYQKFERFSAEEEEDFGMGKMVKSKNLVVEKDIKDLAYSMAETNKYFDDFADNMWFFKRGRVDNYFIACKFESKQQVFFFQFINKFRKFVTSTRKINSGKSSKLSSMVSLKQSITLHKKKKSTASKYLNRSTKSSPRRYLELSLSFRYLVPAGIQSGKEISKLIRGSEHLPFK